MTPDEWRGTVGRQIEAARKAAGLKSMRAAAKAAGFSEATWRQLESGKRQLAPGHVVGPSPKVDTLLAAAVVTRMDPVQLVADAGGSAEDIAYAEDYVHRLRNDLAHTSVAQSMIRNAEGLVGFRTGEGLDADMYAWVSSLPQRDRGRLSVLVQKAASDAAALTARALLERLGVDPDSVQPGDLVTVYWPPEEPARPALRVAADEGSPDPHDDEVGPATDRHPGGAEPVDEPGA